MPRRPAHSGPDSTASDGRSAESRSAARTHTNRLPEPPGEGTPDASLGGIPKTGDSPLRPPDAPAAGREPAQVMTDGLGAKRERRDDAASADARRERRSDVPNETPAEQVGRTSRKP